MYHSRVIYARRNEKVTTVTREYTTHLVSELVVYNNLSSSSYLVRPRPEEGTYECSVLYGPMYRPQYTLIKTRKYLQGKFRST